MLLDCERVDGRVADAPVEVRLPPNAVGARASAAAATAAIEARRASVDARRGRRMTRVLSFVTVS
jgi:hypothetical protein